MPIRVQDTSTRLLLHASLSAVGFRSLAPRQSPDDAFPAPANPDIIGKTGAAAIDPKRRFATVN